MTSQDLYKSALNRRTQIRRDYPEKDMMPEEIKLEFDSVQNAITDYERKSSKESNSSTEYVQPQDMTKEDNGFFAPLPLVTKKTNGSNGKIWHEKSPFVEFKQRVINAMILDDREAKEEIYSDANKMPEGFVRSGFFRIIAFQQEQHNKGLL